MVARRNLTSLVVLLGQTGSGKSALAMRLAEHYNGAIIAADSRTVYRGMDIGTAKPSRSDQVAIPHYGIDVVNPNEHFTAYDFQQLARAALAEISAAGQLAFVVGGTGLYIDGLIYNFMFRQPAPAHIRQQYDGLSVNQLRTMVISAGLPLPDNASNPRHLTRLLESGLAPKQSKRLRPRTLLLGLQLETGILRARLEQRVEQMFNNGLIDETKYLYSQYGDIEALKTPGYRAVIDLINGEIDLAEAKQRFVRADLLLAKRQRTWFRRNDSIHWLTPDDAFPEATNLIDAFLNT